MTCKPILVHWNDPSEPGDEAEGFVLSFSRQTSGAVQVEDVGMPSYSLEQPYGDYDAISETYYQVFCLERFWETTAVMATAYNEQGVSTPSNTIVIVPLPEPGQWALLPLLLVLAALARRRRG